MNNTLTSKKFKTEVLNKTMLSLVQFKTEWNGTCEIIAPLYNELAKSYKHVARFFLIDAEKEKTISTEYHVTETPTILFFFNGVVIDYSVGLISRNALAIKIENALTQTKK